MENLPCSLDVNMMQGMLKPYIANELAVRLTRPTNQAAKFHKKGISRSKGATAAHSCSHSQSIQEVNELPALTPYSKHSHDEVYTIIYH